jgi:hypothetical protein
MKVPQINYYGFNHEGVNKKFTGGLTFMNTISINGTPHAVYKSKAPDKSKGHKKYMLLSVHGDTMYVSGMTPTQIKKYRVATAVHCLECDKLIISTGRHDYVVCGCPNNAIVDGGDCYTRVGAMDLTKIRQPSVDLFTRKVIK